MTPIEAESVARSLVSGHPSHLQAWEAFKHFSAYGVDCETECLAFQAGDSEVEHDSYFDFYREFALRRDDAIWYEQIHFEFSARQPAAMGERALIFSVDFPSNADFFLAVEKSAAFCKAPPIKDWTFRVYHTGV